MIKRNYYKVVRVFPDPSSYFYIKNESMSDGQLYFNQVWLNTVHLEYSFDKINWTLMSSSIGGWLNNIPADGYIYIRNTSNTFCTNEYYGVINIYFDCNLGGDIRTLFNYTDVDSVTTIPAYGLYQPFRLNNNKKVTDISNLSFRGITSIGDYGLVSLFDNDFFKYIGTKGVDLRDVTTLSDYAISNMYYGCSNLTEVYAPNVSTWDTNKTGNWLQMVAPTGVVYKPSTLDIPTDTAAGIPSGWTTQDYPTI